MTVHVYTCSNNGVIGVIGESGKAKLDWVHARAEELRLEIVAAGKSPYSVDVFAVAYNEVGRIPVATFTRGVDFDSALDGVTGTSLDFHSLLARSGSVTEHASFGVPFSNGPHMSRPEDKVSLSELLEIFGLDTNVDVPTRELVTA